MTANLLGLFTQAGSFAKSNAETSAAKSARVAGLMQDGYRLWVDGVTASVGDAGRLAAGLGKVRSPADLAALHRDWLSTTQARMSESVQGFLDVSTKIAAEVAAAPVAIPAVAPAPVVPAAVVPVAPAPVAVAPAAPEAPAPEPVVEPAPVVESVVAATAPEEPAAEEPVVEAPTPAAPAAKAAPRRAGGKTPTTKTAAKAASIVE